MLTPWTDELTGPETMACPRAERLHCGAGPDWSQGPPHPALPDQWTALSGTPSALTAGGNWDPPADPTRSVSGYTVWGNTPDRAFTLTRNNTSLIMIVGLQMMIIVIIVIIIRG